MKKALFIITLTATTIMIQATNDNSIEGLAAAKEEFKHQLAAYQYACAEENDLHLRQLYTKTIASAAKAFALASNIRGATATIHEILSLIKDWNAPVSRDRELDLLQILECKLDGSEQTETLLSHLIPTNAHYYASGNEVNANKFTILKNLLGADQDKIATLILSSPSKKPSEHALLRAIKTGNVELTRLLVQKMSGADVKIFEKILEKQDQDGNTLGHYAASCPASFAMVSCMLEFFDENQIATLFKTANNATKTALQLAQENQKDEIATLLKDYKLGKGVPAISDAIANIQDKRHLAFVLLCQNDFNGAMISPLAFEEKNRSEESIPTPAQMRQLYESLQPSEKEYLLQQRANDPNLLHLLAQNSARTQVIAWLLKGLDASVQEKLLGMQTVEDAFTVLHYAAMNGDVALVQLVKEKAPAVQTLQNAKGQTARDIAVEQLQHPYTEAEAQAYQKIIDILDGRTTHSFILGSNSINSPVNRIAWDILPALCAFSSLSLTPKARPLAIGLTSIVHFLLTSSFFPEEQATLDKTVSAFSYLTAVTLVGKQFVKWPRTSKIV